MYISKLTIKNFKCFGEIEINFDPNFNLIIGENNSGKSTIFEALRLWQLAIQQFYSKRTGKKGDGSNNISFYKKYQFEPLELNDLSFLRIDSLYNILNQKEKNGDEEEQLNDNTNTFLIDVTFSNSIGKTSSIPIIFRPSDKNILRCSIKFNTTTKDEKLNELKSISHSLSDVMSLSNNATFINRIRLAYIPPKFTIPSKEVLLSKDNSFISEKLITGESNLVIRNIIHHWAEFSFQIKTRSKSQETIEKAKNGLSEISIDSDLVKENFISKFKPFIESVLEYNLIAQSNNKSKFLINVEEGLKQIVGQEFQFKSTNNPLENAYLQINDDNKKTEISQLGSGTINILNILAVLNYNDETIKGDAVKSNILLLDEPDSHLQFNLQKGLFDYLENISNSEGKQIFIITHNSSLISQFDKVLFVKNNQRLINPISIEDYLENELKTIDLSHYNVMKELNEVKKNQSQLKNQIKQLSNLEIPLVYTEGPSDVIILESAFKALYPSVTKPFNIVNGSCANHLKNIFENRNTFSKNPSQFQIAVFDFDEAYNQWNGVNKKEYELIENNPFKALTKKNKTNNGFVTLLPVPEIEEIKRQVIKSGNDTFKHNSTLSIEHLFYNTALKDKWFTEENTPGGGNIIKFKGDSYKMDFANETKELPKNYFKNFIPLFKKIADIIGFTLPEERLDA